MDAGAVIKAVKSALRDFLKTGATMMTDDLITFLETQPQFYESTITVAQSLNSYTLYKPGLISGISLERTHDIELDTDHITFSLSLTTSETEDMRQWEDVLKFLEPELANDDKLNTLVRLAHRTRNRS